jgi:hypothetical protein
MALGEGQRLVRGGVCPLGCPCEWSGGWWGEMGDLDSIAANPCHRLAAKWPDDGEVFIGAVQVDAIVSQILVTKGFQDSSAQTLFLQAT